MTKTQPSADTTAFLEYLRDSSAARGLADVIVDVLTKRGHPVLLPVRVDDRGGRRVAS